MRFMMLMIPKGYEKAKPGAMPDPKAVAAMMKYNEALQKAGVIGQYENVVSSAVTDEAAVTERFALDSSAVGTVGA